MQALSLLILVVMVWSCLLTRNIVHAQDIIGFENTCVGFGDALEFLALPEICAEFNVNLCDLSISTSFTFGEEVLLDFDVDNVLDLEQCQVLVDGCVLCLTLDGTNPILTPEYVNLCPALVTTCTVAVPFIGDQEFITTQDLGCVEFGAECQEITDCNACSAAGCGWCNEGTTGSCLPSTDDETPFCSSCTEESFAFYTTTQECAAYDALISEQNTNAVLTPEEEEILVVTVVTVVAVALVMGALFWYIKKKKRRADEAHQEETGYNMAAEQDSPASMAMVAVPLQGTDSGGTDMNTIFVHPELDQGVVFTDPRKDNQLPPLQH